MFLNGRNGVCSQGEEKTCREITLMIQRNKDNEGGAATNSRAKVEEFCLTQEEGHPALKLQGRKDGYVLRWMHSLD